jgi:hypothetical protein
MEQGTRIMEPIPAEDEIRITATPWLDEVSEGRPGDSLEWPAPVLEGDRDLQHRERIDTPRVRHLFPVPDADWDLSHPEFEYSRRQAAYPEFTQLRAISAGRLERASRQGAFRPAVRPGPPPLPRAPPVANR